MRRTIQRAGVAMVASALVLTGCGRGGDDDGEKTSADGIKTDIGVTSEPCPDAVDQEKGCIYLGVISDLTGGFKAVGVPLTAGGAAFWKHVNENGGVGDYEVDVTTYTKDNKYDPETHAQVYSEIKGDVLAVAQSLGTVATETMLKDSDAENLVVIPATLGSNWLFEDRVLEIGTSYCGEAMNSVDYGVETWDAKKIAAVHFPGDYGDDAAVGARIAAEANGAEFTDIPTGPGADQQEAAVKAVLESQADMVFVATGPLELAAVIGGAVQNGFQGKFIGSIPTWNEALLASPAGPAIEASYLWATSFPLWDTDSPGFEAMRAANGDQAPNAYYAIGWSGSYVLKAAIEKAIENGDLTRAGLLKAATSLTGDIDSQGMLPAGTGNYAAGPNDAAVRETLLASPKKGAGTGVVDNVDFFVGNTLKNYEYTEACYLQK